MAQYVVRWIPPVLIPGSIKVSANTLKFQIDWGKGEIVEHKLISLGNKKWIWQDLSAQVPNREIDGLNYLSWEYELGKKGLALDDGTPCFAHIIQTIAEKRPDITIFSDILNDGGFAK